jgi:hypothetical protein
MDVSFKNQCIVLRKKGYSINEIMRLTGRAKTSVYAHIQGIPLSTERWRQIRKASGEHIRTFALARKGKSLRAFGRFDHWTPKKVLLVAHLIFDGEILKGKCAYNNRSEVLVIRFEQLIKSLYSYPAKRRLNRETGVIRSVYYNVALGLYLRVKAEELLRTISRMPLASKREFLRGFFDDEGCMTLRVPSKRQVRGYQKDKSILVLVRSLLADFNISSRIVRPNEVVISGKTNLMRFQKEINFSPGVRINGKRSNSIWKESLEKRVLLSRAIKSFKT